jgi:hypothetical protein
MAVHIPIWPGSASFFPGDTPFGFYDNDSDFQQDAERVADWCATRLGYPIAAVELQERNFYAAFEEAVTEYSNQVNTFSARDNILNLLGFSTGSANYANRYVEPTLRGVFRLAKQYGSEAGAGGTLTWFTGSVSVRSGVQVYDLRNASVETGSLASDGFVMRRLFHTQPPAAVRFLDPTADSGMGSQNMLADFGWGGMSPAVSFTMMPLNYDALRMQAIEFNDQIRRSGYSFQLTNNRLRLFPIPTDDFTLHFAYTLDAENMPGGLHGTNGLGKITNHSNIPYYNIEYRYINDLGKQWIRKYTLALAKEMLGLVRGKYGSLPFGDGEITVNGTDLATAAQTEKEALITELKETLDQFSRQAQLERKTAEATALQQQVAKVPLKIYVR